MTFDDDIIQISFEHGIRRVTCKSIGVEWPPPEEITFEGFTLKRRSMSRLTDEQRESLTHVVRAADYTVVL